MRARTWLDLLTLSRAAVGTTLLARSLTGRRRRSWPAWLLFVFASIPADWLDGPLARRCGVPSAYGELLDLEADSWLTLGGAAAAATAGGLPGFAALPALLRYALLLAALRRASYRDLNTRHPGWARPLGMAQMTLFIAALAPFRGPLTRAAVGLAAPPISVAQLAVLAAVYGRRR